MDTIAFAEIEIADLIVVAYLLTQPIADKRMVLLLQLLTCVPTHAYGRGSCLCHRRPDEGH